jgi:hypothetical protein
MEGKASPFEDGSPAEDEVIEVVGCEGDVAFQDAILEVDRVG